MASSPPTFSSAKMFQSHGLLWVSLQPICKQAPTLRLLYSNFFPWETLSRSSGFPNLDSDILGHTILFSGYLCVVSLARCSPLVITPQTCPQTLPDLPIEQNHLQLRTTPNGWLFSLIHSAYIHRVPPMGLTLI